jgi:hypothetical protein
VFYLVSHILDLLYFLPLRFSMATTLRYECRWIEPGPERHLFSDTLILQGASPVVKTSAELKLQKLVQVANLSPGHPVRAKSNKPHDFKPRLLLMGLRRYEHWHTSVTLTSEANCL